MTTHHLAVCNVAQLLAPLDSPQLADFVAGLDPINALAEAAPGFVWRHQDQTGNSTGVRMLDDPDLIVNLAVWTDVESLRAFAFAGDHLAAMRRRREWFSRMAEPYLVLWWVVAGHEPSVAEAEARLVALRRDGSTPDAFSFGEQFPHSTS